MCQAFAPTQKVHKALCDGMKAAIRAFPYMSVGTTAGRGKTGERTGEGKGGDGTRQEGSSKVYGLELEQNSDQ